MAFCSNCGAQLSDGVKFCSSCGSEVDSNVQQPAPAQPLYQQPVYPQPPVSPEQPAYQQSQQQYPPAQGYYQQPVQQGPYDEAADIASNKAMAILAYLGFLVLIPIFAAKDSKFARYHANQGLLLMLFDLAGAILIGIFGSIFLFTGLFFLVTLLWALYWIAIVAMVILGIVNASSGKLKPLPVIGKITILK